MNEKEKYWLEELTKVSSVLESANINFFLDHGTLLGAVRDKGFIPWDNDIDLGVVNFDIKKRFKDLKNLTSELSQLGYKCKYFGDSLFLFKSGIEFGIKFYKKEQNNYTGFFVDYEKFNIYSSLYFITNYRFYDKVNFASKIKNLIYSATLLKSILKPFSDFFLKKSNLKFVFLTIPETFFDNLANINFYSEKFPTPEETENYLSFKYGDSWNKPKKNYNYLKEDGAISKEK